MDMLSNMVMMPAAMPVQHLIEYSFDHFDRELVYRNILDQPVYIPNPNIKLRVKQKVVLYKVDCWTHVDTLVF